MNNYKDKLIPYPQFIEDCNMAINIGSLSKGSFEFTASGDGSDVFSEAAALIRESFISIAAIDPTESEGSYTIELRVNPDDEKLKKAACAEGYYIALSCDKATICGYDAAGAYYGAVTFSKLIYEENGLVYIPECYIYDYPDFKQRGQFIECRYGTDFMSLDDWKAAVDYFSKMKFNHLTIGLYGCWHVQYDNMASEYQYIPLEKYPELKTPRNIKYYSVKTKSWVIKNTKLPTMYKEDYLCELIAYAKRKNISITPLFNSLGHNTLIPGKFPDVSAKGEDGKPTGYGFCTNNPKTYEILFDIYDKIIESYLKPNGLDSIHIGMDEVWPEYICHCEECEGREHSELMIKHIIKLCKYLKSRGMKTIYVYHDMLYYSFNAINEEFKELLIKEDLYDNLVLDWWSYNDPVNLFDGKSEGVNSLMRSIIKPDTGYYHWVIPSENNDNIRACAALAAERGFEGIESYSSFDYCYDKNYHLLSDVSWNKEYITSVDFFDERYAALRYSGMCKEAGEALFKMHEIMMDEAREDYTNKMIRVFEYYMHSYKFFHLKKYPQSFPGKVFSAIVNKSDEYIPYLREVRKKSADALAFFESELLAPSFINEVWTLSAKHHFVLSDEYLRLIDMEAKYSQGELGADEALDILNSLICQRERLMLLAENVKLEANKYMYLRNMSIIRQYMIDLKNYISLELKEGRVPKIELCDLEYTASDIFMYLR